MDNIIIIIHSNTSYHEVLVACISRFLQYLPSAKLALCIDSADRIKSHFGDKVTFSYLYEYKNEDRYIYLRLMPLLSMIKEEYVLLNFDSNILINYPDTTILDSLLIRMKKENIDQLRLMPSGTIPGEIDNYIFKINNGYFMSLECAFWKKSSLLELSQRFRSYIYHQAECDEIQLYVKSTFNNYCIMPRDDLNQTLKLFTFSDIYPAIHAITIGKWTSSHHQIEHVKKIGEEFNIDLSRRGFD